GDLLLTSQRRGGGRSAEYAQPHPTDVDDDVVGANLGYLSANVSDHGVTLVVRAAIASVSRFCAPPRQIWHTARARASVASAGVGFCVSRKTRITMCATCALSARPLPVTAALTSLGVCSTTRMPCRAADNMATPLAWAVPMTVRTLCWLNTLSTATTSGRCSASQSFRPSSRARRRTARSSSVRE